MLRNSHIHRYFSVGVVFRTVGYPFSDDERDGYPHIASGLSMFTSVPRANTGEDDHCLSEHKQNTLQRTFHNI
ncbi:hypothetical protein KCP71_00125 [Salmonella enterica subsp. enterica]|nr:hypothetical protein KCP71_00125 [Salmonella enterica subsp. enterica]